MSSENGYDVFISVKNLDLQGILTKDYRLAEDLYSFLKTRGHHVFLSGINLQKDGIAQYRRAINSVLEQAQVLVSVGTSSENLESEWVEYEWGSFSNEIRSGRKPNGRIFSYISDMTIRELPFELRQYTCVVHAPDGFEKLAKFIESAESLPAVSSRGDNLTEKGQFPHFAQIVPSLDGVWQGSWKRANKGILHEGKLSIEQHDKIIAARMLISYEKSNVKTIIEELLEGTIDGLTVSLHGKTWHYIHKGKSTTYLLDNFQLQFDERLNTLIGQFYSEKGKGDASFYKHG